MEPLQRFEGNEVPRSFELGRVKQVEHETSESMFKETEVVYGFHGRRFAWHVLPAKISEYNRLIKLLHKLPQTKILLEVADDGIGRDSKDRYLITCRFAFSLDQLLEPGDKEVFLSIRDLPDIFWFLWCGVKFLHERNIALGPVQLRDIVIIGDKDLWNAAFAPNRSFEILSSDPSDKKRITMINKDHASLVSLMELFVTSATSVEKQPTSTNGLHAYERENFQHFINLCNIMLKKPTMLTVRSILSHPVFMWPEDIMSYLQQTSDLIFDKNSVERYTKHILEHLRGPEKRPKELTPPDPYKDWFIELPKPVQEETIFGLLNVIKEEKDVKVQCIAELTKHRDEGEPWTPEIVKLKCEPLWKKLKMESVVGLQRQLRNRSNHPNAATTAARNILGITQSQQVAFWLSRHPKLSLETFFFSFNFRSTYGFLQNYGIFNRYYCGSPEFYEEGARLISKKVSSVNQSSPVRSPTPVRSSSSTQSRITSQPSIPSLGRGSRLKLSNIF